MTRRTDRVRIDDLASPRHLPQVIEMGREAERIAPQLRFDPDALCEQAIRETGIATFGSQDFRARLALLLRSLEAEGRLSRLGRVTRYQELLRFLKNRLRVEDRIARHAEILEIEIARPIVITGFPRSGTTHLHNSLAADPELRFLPYWEALEPVLPESERPAPGQPDPRLARCEAALAWVNGALPYFRWMHEMTVGHAHEEIDLLALDFSTMYFETPGPLALWTAHYKASDQTPHYAYLKRVLQVLTFLRGGKRWVLKSPQHLEQLRPLAKVFPDATLVITHRDPLPVMASFATLMTYTARLAQERPDPLAYGRYAADRTADLLEACVRDRALWSPERSIDVRFDELVADQDAAVERLYALAGQPLSAASRRAIADYAAAHPQGRHGRLRYDLAEFGLDAGALRERFRPYTERFGLRLEL
jgi:hypothetical protein